MFWAFAAASLISATLLFFVQPLLGKQLLPTFGGAPAVWTTALLFFQSALLAGYATAHALVRTVPRHLGRAYIALLVVSALTLPIGADRIATPDLPPTIAVLVRLTIGVGLPFVALSAASPLLQRAYAARVPDRDPYMLYAASNAGSFFGLLAFPFVLEPVFAASTVRAGWSVTFLVAAGALALTVGPTRLPDDGRPTLPGSHRPDRRTIATWIGLAALPVSLLLGATSYITTDVAAVPLFWVAPLGLYLLTFVLAFGPAGDRWRRWADTAAIPLGIAAVGAMSDFWPFALAATAILAAFGAIALAIHGRLHRLRPQSDHLTTFYLAIAVGGALGGAFNAIAAPLLFPAVFEFPLALAAGFAVLTSHVGSDGPAADSRLPQRAFALLLPAGGVLAATRLPLGASIFVVALVAVGVALPRLRLDRRRLALSLAILLLAPLVTKLSGLYADRSFFGSYRVFDSGGVRVLTQGTTQHGAQDPDDPDLPLSYYHPEGPLGDVIRASVAYPQLRLGVVGLGAGAIAAYADESGEVVFHEIDPKVVEIARDPALFTYLSDAEVPVEVIIGDGRLTLAELPSASYDLLALDAFSSDAVPAHLLTLEAFEIYGHVLAGDGLLALHISNRHLDLSPVVAAGVDHLGWSAMIRHDLVVTPPRLPSTWVAAAPDPQLLEGLPDNWQHLDLGTPIRWTDDFSNILSVLD